ncbi:putative lipo domain protein [Burkholderia pseudomallei A79D]|nr:putative lipo domain protein [Burkholderia pseudomallei A79D]KGX97306.1 putative lipo domain protein [Burkholderia pseudomallei A79C]
MSDEDFRAAVPISGNACECLQSLQQAGNISRSDQRAAACVHVCGRFRQYTRGPSRAGRHARTAPSSICDGTRRHVRLRAGLERR